MAIMNNQGIAAALSTNSNSAFHWTSTAASGFKIMFASTLYSSGVFADQDFVDDGTTSDLKSREMVSSSIRKNVTSRTITVVDASNKVQYDGADITSTSTGGNVGYLALVGPGTADNVRRALVLWAASEWSTAGVNLDGNSNTFTFSTDGLFKSSGA